MPLGLPARALDKHQDPLTIREVLWVGCSAMGDAPNYKKPGWFTNNVFNRAVALLSRMGVSLAGSRRLTVRGRKSGEPRTVPVNPLELDGTTYLVSPRGHTQWVRTLRAAGEGILHHGSRATHFRGDEIADEDKLPILKAYLDKWAWEVGAFFELDKNHTDADLRRIAPDHPVFRVRSDD
jgi:deazaflavin-dependent oxidoreductase (nitroreductase family)